VASMARGAGGWDDSAMNGNETSGRVLCDYFISYTQPDRPWAEWVAWELESHGFKVILQAWDFGIGSNWVDSMHTAMQDASTTIAILSSAYIESEYGTAEWQTAWRQDPLGRKRKLMFLRVEDCARPGLMGNIVSLDLFGQSKSQARQSLRVLSAGPLTSHSRPTKEPTFPPEADREAVSSERRDTRPAIWNLPNRNANFTGRETNLQAVRNGLARTTTVTVQALNGLGGVGKTQTVIEYAHRFAGEYELVWWFDAEKPSVLDHQMAAFAVQLGLPPAVDPTATVQAVRHDLRRRRAWLLIFDNAESVEDIGNVLPSGSGHILVTTRRSGFRSLGQVHDIDVLPRPDSIALMRRRAPALTGELADQLAEQFGDLPLAMAQAAAYIDETSTPPSTYIDLLRTHTGPLLARGKADNYPFTIRSAWSVAIEALGPVCPESIELLHLCAWLAPEPISLNLFYRNRLVLPSSLARAAADELTINDVAGYLASYSLARRTDVGLVLHRLVQSAIREMSVSIEGEHPLALVLELLHRDLRDEGFEYDRSLGEFAKWGQQLPHVIAAIDNYTDDIPVNVESLAWLMHHAGTHLPLADPRIGKYLRRALAIYERTYGSEHPLVGGVLTDLGWHLEDSFQWVAARDILERAVRVQKAAYGSDDPRVAAVLTHYAAALIGLEEPASALPLLGHALHVHEEKSGPSHPATATTLNSLGMVHQALGRPDSAKPLLERAVAIRQEVFGFDHPWTATHMTNLSGVLADLGELSAARDVIEEALAIREAAYGADSIIAAHSLHHLGRILIELGDPTAARRVLARALRLREARFGAGHRSVQLTKQQLARLQQ